MYWKLGRGLISAQPDADGGELDHGEIVCGELLVSGGDAPAVLQAVEEALDPVALAVERRAEGVALLAVAAIGDVRGGALVLDLAPDLLGEQFVGD